MKKQFLGWISAAMLFAGITLFFTQCETDLNKIDKVEAMDLAAGAINSAGLVADAAGGGGGTAAGVVDVCTCIYDQFEIQAPLEGEEVDALLYMREEEKLARDVYLALFELYDFKVFSNIAKAEQRHMDMIECLLTRYEIQDPVGDDEPGVFQNSDLSALYTQLMDLGDNSLQDALLAGATIEDVDIYDLKEQIALIDNEDIIAVFNELSKGSRNHLRAFYKNLLNNDITYEAQYIDQAELEAIVNSPWERGNGICAPLCPNGGNGPGNGNGGNCPYGNGGGNGNGPGNGNGGNCPYGNTGGGNGPGGGNGGNCPYGNTGGGNGNGGNGNGGNGNGGNGNGGNGNGGNGNGGNGNGGNGNGNGGN